MPPEIITWSVILGVVLLAIAYAAWLSWRTDGRVTLTDCIEQWATEDPAIPLWIGILLGHLFAQMGGHR